MITFLFWHLVESKIKSGRVQLLVIDVVKNKRRCFGHQNDQLLKAENVLWIINRCEVTEMPLQLMQKIGVLACNAGVRAIC